MPCTHEAEVFQSAIENSGTAYQTESDAADALVAAAQALVDAQDTASNAQVELETASMAADAAQQTEYAAYQAWAECRRANQGAEEVPEPLPTTVKRIDHRALMQRLQDVKCTNQG